MIKVTLWMVFLAAVSYLIMCALLYARQRSMIYYPTHPTNSGEAKVIWLSHQGQSLKVWHIPGSSDRALIYFGGNAEDVAMNIPQFKRLFPEYSIYLHNYRGYGGSTGSISENALFSDAGALYDFVKTKHREIAVIGRSLGTGVAVFLASEEKVRRLVLVTPFDSMVNLARSYYWLVPVSLLLKDRFDSLSRVARLATPTLVLIAEHDEVIPRKRADTLVSALKPEITRVEVIKGAGHNTIGSYPQYEKVLSAFLDKPQSVEK
jgi:pimeloyl-ACP methyl ester carboxylesterase